MNTVYEGIGGDDYTFDPTSWLIQTTVYLNYSHMYSETISRTLQIKSRSDSEKWLNRWEDKYKKWWTDVLHRAITDINVHEMHHNPPDAFIEWLWENPITVFAGHEEQICPVVRHAIEKWGSDPKYFGVEFFGHWDKDPQLRGPDEDYQEGTGRIICCEIICNNRDKWLSGGGFRLVGNEGLKYITLASTHMDVTHGITISRVDRCRPSHPARWYYNEWIDGLKGQDCDVCRSGNFWWFPRQPSYSHLPEGT